MLVYGTVAAIENWVERPSSLGDARPTLMECGAMVPVAPSLPQAPQVSQSGVSSTLSMIVEPAGAVPPLPVVPLGGAAAACVLWEAVAPTHPASAKTERTTST